MNGEFIELVDISDLKVESFQSNNNNCRKCSLTQRQSHLLSHHFTSLAKEKYTNIGNRLTQAKEIKRERVGQTSVWCHTQA